ncbi:aspartate/methionine/tyrosine aminotransferase [Sphingomonas jinjuensis]|uniref:Aspartate/methionine/tyrosine aminotransferase n=1 Tax=Sphingomonas jinjuensis TaxID=535907 RepID=A0A840FC32_9SPHN|nr:pyridoxal phosphate-dependent aminotransferase [Sphingomonas jinjuensis]MBB4155570.1 aspartate/methionine/tyrosine aminotransferase [Sphingomonas jinjuensis]
MTAIEAMTGDSYAEWVRRTLMRMRESGGRIVPLFDSSVPEPRALLTDLVARSFAEPVTDRYASAFANGNPFVMAHLARAYGVGRDQLIATTGATGALSILYRALVTPGERILVETPGFDLFSRIGDLHGIAVDRFVRAAPDFALDVDAIAAALTPTTRLVVLSNLHNPSGAPCAHEAMVALARLAEARGVLVLVDEVYGDYADAATRPVPAMRLSPNIITISSLTKIYGLSSLRCGWIVGDAGVLAPVRTLVDRFEFGISNLAHAAAALVFDEQQLFDAWSRDCVAAARPIAEAALDEWRAAQLIEGELPTFGCIVFPRLIGIDDTLAFADWLAKRCGVVVAPGEYFGAPGHVRIGFARPPADLAYALDGLGEGLCAYRALKAVA